MIYFEQKKKYHKFLIMARIYDNIETKFAEGLQGIITNVGVKRVDFCVGYFNLRGWNFAVEQIVISQVKTCS